MKKIARTCALSAVAMIAAVGALSIPTAAEADTGWGWRISPTRTSTAVVGDVASDVTAR